MEHWLPFYYERLDTLFDYLPGAPVVFDHLAHEAIDERHKLILDYYEARRQQAGCGAQGRGALQADAARTCIYLSPDDVCGRAGRARCGRVHALRHAGCRPAQGAFMPARAPATASPKSAPTPTPTCSTPRSGTSPRCAPPSAASSSPAGRKARSTAWPRSSPSTSSAM